MNKINFLREMKFQIKKISTFHWDACTAFRWPSPYPMPPNNSWLIISRWDSNVTVSSENKEKNKKLNSKLFESPQKHLKNSLKIKLDISIESGGSSHLWSSLWLDDKLYQVCLSCGLDTGVLIKCIDISCALYQLKCKICF